MVSRLHFHVTRVRDKGSRKARTARSEEHTSELQSRLHLVCRLLLEKKNNSSVIRFIAWPTAVCPHRGTDKPLTTSGVDVQRPLTDFRILQLDASTGPCHTTVTAGHC